MLGERFEINITGISKIKRLKILKCSFDLIAYNAVPHTL